MLVLSRKKHEEIVIVIGNGITITIVDIRGDKVRIGIKADENVAVHRKEIYDRILAEGEHRTHRNKESNGQDVDNDTST